ncbi:MAG: hypothetical protein JWP82_2622 [Humibacillus sp.]|nr:hypothetical protein [Humibacillus sp.]
MQHRRLLVVGGAIALCLLVTSCGGGSTTGGGTGDDTPSRIPSATSSTTTDPGPTGMTGVPGSTTRLAGRVERAGEGACLHLRAADGVEYELIGATSGLTLGREAVVVGRVDRSVQPQCGSGVPFVVVSATTGPTSMGTATPAGP